MKQFCLARQAESIDVKLVTIAPSFFYAVCHIYIPRRFREYFVPHMQNA